MNAQLQLQPEQEVVIERLDDIPLLVSLQQQLGLDEVIEYYWLHHSSSFVVLPIAFSAVILYHLAKVYDVLSAVPTPILSS